MISVSASIKLLRRVSLRLGLAALGWRMYLFSFWGVLAFAALLVVSRLTGYGTGMFSQWTLLMVPTAAALLAVLMHRRPTALEAARAVDAHSGTKDLFLTVALIEKSAGDYQPLVAQTAELQAPRIQPVQVVPFECHRQLGNLAAIASLALAVLLWVPQFDPFGQVEASQRVAKKQRLLEDTKLATAARKAQIKPESTAEEGEMSAETKKAIEGLKAALNKMRPKTKTENSSELATQQKQLGQMWRNLKNDKMKELFSHSPEEQQFGSANREKMQKWTKELQQGSSASMQKELDEALEDLERLAQTSDPKEKAELEQKVRKQLKELNQMATDRVGSKPLTAALQRAMQQLEMSRMEGMDPKEAIEAMRESLELSKMELQEVAQSAKDIQKLEEGLKMLQMAKQLNEQEQLDGEQTAGMEDMADYEEFYEQLMAELGLSTGEGAGQAEGEGDSEGEGQGEGEGEGEGDSDGEGDGRGLGARGMGRGGAAPEDDSVATDFQTELSKSPVTKGKVLMSMKSKGLSDRGDDKASFRDSMPKSKQGLQEAIEQEQVPPGYHENIKTYFGKMQADESEKSSGKE